MNKFDIEFYNGLMKGIVKCAGIVKKSVDLKEANEQIDDLLKKIQKKIDVMVECKRQVKIVQNRQLKSVHPYL